MQKSRPKKFYKEHLYEVFYPEQRHDDTILNINKRFSSSTFNEAQKKTICTEAIDWEYHTSQDRETYKQVKFTADMRTVSFTWNFRNKKWWCNAT